MPIIFGVIVFMLRSSIWCSQHVFSLGVNPCHHKDYNQHFAKFPCTQPLIVRSVEVFTAISSIIDAYDYHLRSYLSQQPSKALALSVNRTHAEIYAFWSIICQTNSVFQTKPLIISNCETMLQAHVIS